MTILPSASLTYCYNTETPNFKPSFSRAEFTRISEKKLEIEVTFKNPLPDNCRVGIRFGFLFIGLNTETEIYADAVGLAIYESGLWKEKWDECNCSLDNLIWSEHRLKLKFDLILPEKFECIPAKPNVAIEQFVEGRWPFMTSDEWFRATEPFG